MGFTTLMPYKRLTKKGILNFAFCQISVIILYSGILYTSEGSTKASLSVVIESDITIAELDEAIGYLNDRLKIDQYGNRMDWRKRQTIQEAIDDLLDERLLLTNTVR